jgi:hypothetical protein
MKTKSYIIAFLSIGLLLGFSTRSEIIKNQASDSKRLMKVERPFKTGEKLTYVLHYGIFNAGIAEIFIRSTEKPFIGHKKVLNMIGKGRTL